MCSPDCRQASIILMPCHVSRIAANDRNIRFPMPDGERVVFRSNRDGNREIYTMRLDGRDLRRLTTDPAEDGEPVWSPDGRRILFSTRRAGEAEADGGNVVRLVPR